MTTGFQLSGLNETGTTWTLNYRVGEDPKTVTVPADASRTVLATHYFDGVEWVELHSAKVVSSSSVVADLFPSSPAPPVVEAITVFIGVISAIAFWTQANPFRK